MVVASRLKYSRKEAYAKTEVVQAVFVYVSVGVAAHHAVGHPFTRGLLGMTIEK